MFSWLKKKVKSLNKKRTVADLAAWLEYPEETLAQWENEQVSGYSYRRFYIPKRSGNGRRLIHAPNKNLRDLQRLIYLRLIKQLPVHDAATGFVPHRSIVDNARRHVGKDVVINIDLKDFFPSIKSAQVQAYWLYVGWDKRSAAILTNICCHNGELPQGAPTSPGLSNAVNMLLDARLDALAKAFKGEYTRYADDMTFSFAEYGGHKRGFIFYVRNILGEHGYQIQMKKRIRIQRSHQRQTVTGLVVNKQVNLPRRKRRQIRAMQHRRSLNQLSFQELNQLAGYESLLKMIETQR